MENNLVQKYESLKNELRMIDGAIIAFSGGVDSVLVLKAAHDILGDKAVAVTADSPSLPRRELEETKKIAEEIGARHIIINTAETENQEYLKNPGNRCYYCKAELYSKLKELSKEIGIKNILNGTNHDDLRDYRPGLKAAEEHKIISPLKDAQLTKDDVREVAKFLKLRSWGKPSSPCLSSRIQYGQEITLRKLKMVEQAENLLKDLGIKELRVRHFGKTARIEVREENKIILNDNIDFINKKFSIFGFDGIEIANFKSGNLNLILKNE